MKLKKTLSAVGGFLSGAVNGLLGAGGGMIAVPMLSKSGLDAKKSHATSVAVILPICVFSSILYLTDGRVTLGDAAPYLLWGALGSLIGSWLLPKMKDVWIHRIFGALMLWAAVRMLFR